MLFLLQAETVDGALCCDPQNLPTLLWLSLEHLCFVLVSKLGHWNVLAFLKKNTKVDIPENGINIYYFPISVHKSAASYS